MGYLDSMGTTAQFAGTPANQHVEPAQLAEEQAAFDREVLDDYYRHELSQREIGEKRGLAYPQVYAGRMLKTALAGSRRR